MQSINWVKLEFWSPGRNIYLWILVVIIAENERVKSNRILAILVEAAANSYFMMAHHSQ